MTAADSTSPPPRPPEHGANPDAYRMTIGEHLEELRRRIILGLIGFVAVTFVCMCFGKKLVVFFCLPLYHSLAHNHINPQPFTSYIEEGFAVYIKISLITGAALSAPWVVYQLWKFVAAGLYPHERKYITRYIPLSITLLIAGMVFMYVLVLPITLNFFLSFSFGAPMSFDVSPALHPSAAATQPLHIPVLGGDPPNATTGDLWVNAATRQIKFFFGDETRVISFGANTLTTPQITLSSYIDMVVNLLVSFGLAFQLPLVVMALARVGIVEIATLKRFRKYIVFTMAVVAAFIIPDVVTGMLALMVPLIGLYEFGILLASWGQKKDDKVRG